MQNNIVAIYKSYLKKVAQRLDMVTTFETPLATQTVIPADNKDFSRPKEPFQYQIPPNDSSLADDSTWKDILNQSKSPTQTPIDNNPWKNILNQKSNPTEPNPEIKSNESPQTQPQSQSNDLIKSFQSFLSNSNPVIGQVYSGPIDGLPSLTLSQAAKQVEDKISSLTKSSATGMLWNDSKNNFNTSVSDLSTALDLLSKNNIKKD